MSFDGLARLYWASALYSAGRSASSASIGAVLLRLLGLLPLRLRGEPMPEPSGGASGSGTSSRKGTSAGGSDERMSLIGGPSSRNNSRRSRSARYSLAAAAVRLGGAGSSYFTGRPPISSPPRPRRSY